MKEAWIAAAEMENHESPITGPIEERKALIAEAKRQGLVIITHAMAGRSYSGMITGLGASYAVQKIGEGRGIIQRLENINMGVGDNVVLLTKVCFKKANICLVFCGDSMLKAKLEHKKFYSSPRRANSRRSCAIKDDTQAIYLLYAESNMIVLALLLCFSTISARVSIPMFMIIGILLAIG